MGPRVKPEDDAGKEGGGDSQRRRISHRKMCESGSPAERALLRVWTDTIAAGSPNPVAPEIAP